MNKTNPTKMKNQKKKWIWETVIVLRLKSLLSKAFPIFDLIFSIEIKIVNSINQSKLLHTFLSFQILYDFRI